VRLEELRAVIFDMDGVTYARVLLAVLDGDPVFSFRDDEAEEAWRIVEPILEAWSAELVPMIEYPAGSGGPVESHPGGQLRGRG
jgi:glucose-6-phosphate 1-dehydrogenase